MSKITMGVILVVVVVLAVWAYIAYLMPSNSATPTPVLTTSTSNSATPSASPASPVSQAPATGNPDDIINQAISGGSQEQALVQQSDSDLSATTTDNQTINDFSGAYNANEVK